MKHPPEQYPDDEAYRMMEKFIRRLSDVRMEILPLKSHPAAGVSEN